MLAGAFDNFTNYSFFGLIEAAKQGNLEDLHQLLKIDSLRNNPQILINALAWAARNGHLTLVRELLKMNLVKKNVASEYNKVINAAAINLQFEVILELLKYESVQKNIFEIDNQALKSAVETVHPSALGEIFQAVSTTDLQRVNQLLILNTGPLSNLALQYAVKNCDHECFKKLLTIDALRKHAADYNYFVVGFAVEHEKFDIVLELLKIDAVKESAQEYILAAFRKAVKNDHFEIVRELLNFDVVKTNIDTLNNALCKACKNGHFDMVFELLKIDLVRDNAHLQYNKALSFACANGRLDIVRELLNIDSVKQNAAALGCRALKKSVANGHVDIVFELLEISIVSENVPEKMMREFSALKSLSNDDQQLMREFLVAVKNGSLNKMRALLQVDVVKQYVAALENLPLRLAAGKGNIDAVRLLLMIPAVRSKVTAMGNLAFTLAVQYGHLEVVRELYHFESVKNCISANEEYALSLVNECEHLKMIQYLLSIDTVKRILLHNRGEKLIELITGSSFEWVLPIFESLEVYGVSLAAVINKSGATSMLADIQYYISDPENYLNERFRCSLAKKHAARILKTYQDMCDYQAQLRALGIVANVDDPKKIAKIIRHFNEIIKPNFKEKFDSFGNTDEERIVAIERNIRELILTKIREKALEDKQEYEQKEEDYNAHQEQEIIRFIDNHFDKLCDGLDDDSMRQARIMFCSTTQSAQIAWRCYDAQAPYRDEQFPNLLTKPKDNRVIHSIVEVHEGEMNAQSASEIAREIIAYSYCLVTDEKMKETASQKDKIENFITQLQDIRRAHNDSASASAIDSPSCLPGIIERAGRMWLWHPLSLSKEPTELLSEILSTRVIVAFRNEFKKCQHVAQQEALYNSLIMLRKENAQDVLNNKDKIDEIAACRRQEFIETLGTPTEIFAYVNEELGKRNVEPLINHEMVYIQRYLADIGGGWVCSQITDSYLALTGLMQNLEIEDEFSTNQFLQFPDSPLSLIFSETFQTEGNKRARIQAIESSDYNMGASSSSRDTPSPERKRHKH